MIDTPTVDWAALSPILALLGGAAAIMLAAPFAPGRMRNAIGASFAAVAFAGALAAVIALFVADDTGRGIIADAMRRDRLAELAEILIYGTGLLAVLLGLREHNSDERRAEYYALVLSAGAGMGFFVAANDLVSLFLGLEWFSISLYILCAITLSRAGALESGLKYLIIGGFSSAILLFGSALVFGATGETGFAEIGEAAGSADRLLLVAGLALLLVGLGFKVSAAPFHQWTPDVYEGAPTPVTAFMAAATKIAAIVLTLRFLTVAFPTEAELWTITLGVLATASLAWGNLAALVQRDVKRLLAYSSVSHAGFLLMPVAAGNAIGGRAVLYYLIPYAALSVGSFAVVLLRERELQAPVTLDSLSGMGWERPFLGVSMWVFMLGFAGFPLTGGFVGKFYAFSAAYDRGWVWLMIVGVVATLVSLYYYLGIVRAMYFRSPAELQLLPAGGSPPREVALQIGVGLALAVTVGSFFAVEPLITIARHAAATLAF